MENISYEVLIEALNVWPFLKGKPLMVHSALSSFGTTILGGANMVLDAFLDFLGEEGTLLMPTLSFSSVDEKHPYYNASTTPSDCGLLTQTFLKRKGVYRSAHVVSSAAAMGKDAKDFTAQHFHTPCAPDSPYGKLIERGGYVLFLGTDLDCNTLFHAAEEAVNPSYLQYAVIHNAHCIWQDGREYVGDFLRYDCYQQGIMRYLYKMEPFLEQAGVLKHQKVAASRWTLVSAQDDFRLCCQALRQNLSYLMTP